MRQKKTSLADLYGSIGDGDQYLGKAPGGTLNRGVSAVDDVRRDGLQHGGSRWR